MNNYKLGSQNIQSMSKSKPTFPSNKIANTKMTLDLHKLDIKSPTVFPSTTANASNKLKSTSPSNSIDPLVFSFPNRSPKGKQSPTLLTEEYEPKENPNSAADMRVYPQSTKHSKPYAPVHFQDKLRNNNNTPQMPDKIPSYRQKDDGPKTTTIAMIQSSPKNSDSGKPDLRNFKQKPLDDKNKKPSNLTLTLQNATLAKGMSSPVAPNSAKGQTFDPTIRKGSHANILDSKNITHDKINASGPAHSITPQPQSQAQSQLHGYHPEVKSSTPTPTPYSLNNFLVDLGSLSSDPNMKISKININNINNINTINNNNNESANKGSTPKDSTTQYKELLKILNDKNSEINRLTQDKMELKAALDSLTGEVRSLGKMKVAMKEKDKLIEKMNSTLSETVRETNEIKRSIQRDSKENYGSSPVPPETEGIKNLMEQLKHLPDPESDDMLVADKKALLELVSKNQPQSTTNAKRPVSSYMLSNLEYRTERNSNPVNAVSTSQLFQRNFSTTIEDHINKKLTESPYYENIKNSLKKNPTKITFGAKKTGSAVKKNISSSNKQIKPPVAANANTSQRSSETPRQLHSGLNISTKPIEKADRVMPQTTTAHLDYDAAKRKFSHEPKLQHDTFMASFFNKKHSTNVQTDEVKELSLKKEEDQPTDINKALVHLKDRVKNLLSKHKNNHDKLKKINEAFMQKLEGLSITH
jgi:hypothetical protein